MQALCLSGTQTTHTCAPFRFAHKWSISKEDECDKFGALASTLQIQYEEKKDEEIFSFGDLGHYKFAFCRLHTG
jgi:hypothetical protein